ncbi:hypothetical protein QL996_14265 [Planococcus sp. APC 4015]|nr:hypothetical protein [Planococcus sp. APC 4015]
MSRSARTALSVVGIALLVAGALTGCATAIGAGGSASTPSESAGASNEIEVDAAWLDGGRIVGLVTYGSSTCIPTAVIETVENGVLEVSLVDDPDAACTRDMVPRVTPIELMGDVDPTQDLEIRVTGEGYYGDTDLDGVAGLAPAAETDYLPTAGWTDEDGQFIILSWGSSTCLPVVEDVVAAGSDVTVTFATPPADQACTMDMVPRGVIAQVMDLDEDDDVFAILQGAEFAGARIPIVGSN